MATAVRDVVEAYREALKNNDYPSRTGILLGLMRMLIWQSLGLEAPAKATAEEILKIEDEER